jgi:hypothetical protein
MVQAFIDYEGRDQRSQRTIDFKTKAGLGKFWITRISGQGIPLLPF